MTLLTSWIGIDTHGPTSAYIAADSRISWGEENFFDYGKKVFASKCYPEIFGYAGDVLFPSIVLSQIVEMIDTNVLFHETMTCREKNKTIFEKLQYTFTKYPDVYGSNPIQVLHISRDTIFCGYPKFYNFLLSWDRRTGWRAEEIDIPDKSGLLHVLGSGRNEFMLNYKERYQKGGNKSTSRNVFHCFVDTLNNIEDLQCGGAPQLVGIYRKPFTSAQNYGIIFNKKRFLLGMEIPREASFNGIEWRNELFEICNGQTKKLEIGAARQEDPLRRKK